MKNTVTFMKMTLRPNLDGGIFHHVNILKEGVFVGFYKMSCKTIHDIKWILRIKGRKDKVFKNAVLCEEKAIEILSKDKSVL